MSIELVMPSNHLILCCPLLLLHSIFLSIRVFSSESALRIRWLKYWSFSFSISPSNEYSGLISFRMDWLALLAVQGTLKSLLQHHSSKASILRHSAFFMAQLSHPYMTTGKTIALTRLTFVDQVRFLLFNSLSRFSRIPSWDPSICLHVSLLTSMAVSSYQIQLDYPWVSGCASCRVGAVHVRVWAQSSTHSWRDQHGLQQSLASVAACSPTAGGQPDSGPALRTLLLQDFGVSSPCLSGPHQASTGWGAPSWCSPSSSLSTQPTTRMISSGPDFTRLTAPWGQRSHLIYLWISLAQYRWHIDSRWASSNALRDLVSGHFVLSVCLACPAPHQLSHCRPSALRRSHPANTLILTFKPPELCNSNSLLFASCSLGHFVTQPELTSTSL